VKTSNLTYFSHDFFLSFNPVLFAICAGTLRNLYKNQLPYFQNFFTCSCPKASSRRHHYFLDKRTPLPHFFVFRGNITCVKSVVSSETRFLIRHSRYKHSQGTSLPNIGKIFLLHISLKFLTNFMKFYRRAVIPVFSFQVDSHMRLPVSSTLNFTLLKTRHTKGMNINRTKGYC
jgi:hypothetical protein